MPTADSPLPLQEDRKTILVVDDEPLILGLVRNMLRKEGYAILEASDGREALQVFAEHAHTIHLLLTDIVMPSMNGYQLADAMRAQSPDLRVLFMSGYQDRVISDVTGFAVQAAALIRKPFTQHGLTSKIAQILAESTRSATSGQEA
jgi:CheY-like chemotaxis protein